MKVTQYTLKRDSVNDILSFKSIILFFSFFILGLMLGCSEGIKYSKALAVKAGAAHYITNKVNGEAKFEYKKCE